MRKKIFNFFKFCFYILTFTFLSCNSNSDEQSSCINNVLDNQRNNLEIRFNELCKNHGSKGKSYLEKYEIYKKTSSEFETLILSDSKREAKALEEMALEYTNAIKKIPINTIGWHNTQKTIIDLFKNTPRTENSIINSYLISSIFILEELFNEFDEYDFKFDFIQIKVQPNNKIYKINDSIKFQISLNAYNTYSNDKVILEEKDQNRNILSYDTLSSFNNGKSGILYYSSKPKQKGRYVINGRYFFFEEEIPFEINYEVK